MIQYTETLLPIRNSQDDIEVMRQKTIMTTKMIIEIIVTRANIYYASLKQFACIDSLNPYTNIMNQAFTFIIPIL